MPLFVAEGPTEPVEYVDPGLVGPGLIGFVAFIFLGVATVLLWRSMNKQLKRIDFDEEGAVRPVNAPFSKEDLPAEGGPTAASVSGQPASGVETKDPGTGS